MLDEVEGASEARTLKSGEVAAALDGVADSRKAPPRAETKLALVEVANGVLDELDVLSVLDVDVVAPPNISPSMLVAAETIAEATFVPAGVADSGPV